MTKRGASPDSPAEKPTVYRGVGALLGGIVAVLFCLYGAIDLLVEAGSADLVGAAVLLLVAALALIFGVYPAAYSDDDGLHVRNPFRTIRVSWPAVTDLAANLSFVVHTEGARYTVFAIPVSLRDRRRAEKQRLKDVAAAQRVARRGARGGGRNPADAYTGLAPSPRRREEHIERMALADQAISEMNARKDAYAVRAKIAAKTTTAGTGNGKGNGDDNGKGSGSVSDAQPTGAGTPAAPVVTWTWPSFVLTGAAALFLIVAIIVK
jgi:hypothetical protein